MDINIDTGIEENSSSDRLYGVSLDSVANERGMDNLILLNIQIEFGQMKRLLRKYLCEALKGVVS